MGNPKIKNNIISSTLRQEMKKEYELGISLRELAFKHNLSYGSLRNYASNHDWVKGSKSVLIAAQELILETEELAKQREEIKKQFRDLTQQTLSIISQAGLDKSKTEAFRNQAQGLNQLYALSKELYNIRTPKEDLELRETYIKYCELLDHLQDEGQVIHID